MGVKKAANLLWLTPLNSCYLTFLSLQRDSLFYKIMMYFFLQWDKIAHREYLHGERRKNRHARSKLSKVSLFRKILREDPLLVASGIEPC